MPYIRLDSKVLVGAATAIPMGSLAVVRNVWSNKINSVAIHNGLKRHLLEFWSILNLTISDFKLWFNQTLSLYR